MGLDNLQEVEQEESPDQPSISYLYLYESGRDEVENWPDSHQEKMAEAYQVTSNGGVVRDTFKRTGQYVNIHDATAHLMVGIADVFRDDDFSDLLEFIGPDADAVGQYLDDNPEVRDELLSRLEDTQATG